MERSLFLKFYCYFNYELKSLFEITGTDLKRKTISGSMIFRER